VISRSRIRLSSHAYQVCNHNLDFTYVYIAWKSPATFSEVTYETKPFNMTFKYDTNGKTGAELKLKQIADGLTVTAKAGHGKHGLDGEVVNEYLVPDTNVHSSLTVTSGNRFAFSTVFKPTGTFVLGAELTGSTALNNLKLAVADQVTFGKTVVGAKVTQDFNSGATHLDATVGLTEGNTDLVAHVAHNFAKSGLPSASFLVKHNVDKNLWVKAAVNDALEVKVSSAYKVNDKLTTTLGFAVNNNAKTDADRYKVGVKAVFAL
jgi:hypothetical protein